MNSLQTSNRTSGNEVFDIMNGQWRHLVLLVVSLSWTTAHGYEVVDVESAGSLTGTIQLDGAPPPIDMAIIGKDNHVCGEGHATMNPVHIDDNGGLANAVVVIEGITSGKPFASETASTRGDVLQRDCLFEPYVQVTVPDAQLSIVNEDPLLHNIHAYEQIGRARRTLFNIAQPKAGQVDTHQLKLRRGHVVEIVCDAHNWMSAWVYTADHPYWHVSASNGSYQIDDIPPGKYKVTIWHPTLGTRTEDVTISAAEETSMDIVLTGTQG